MDLDDVLLDFNAGMALYHNSIYGTSFTRDQIKFPQLELAWGCTREEAHQRIADFYQTEEHSNVLPVRGAVEATRELAKNHELIIVTAKPPALRERTLKWLDKHYPGIFKDIHFTNQFISKGTEKITKVEVCDQEGIEIFIDDFPHNAIEIAESGRKVFLLDCPWNQIELPFNIVRVYSWKEIVEKIGQGL